MSDPRSQSPLEIPELVKAVIGFVEEPSDLLTCACVSNLWNIESLRRLYRGSLRDMKLRTPAIESLNSLFVASRERFAQNMSFVEHLLLCSDEPVQDMLSFDEHTKMTCVQKCRALRDRKSSELLFQAKGKGCISLAIPFELVDQRLTSLYDLILQPRLEFLTIDDVYCRVMSSSFIRLREKLPPGGMPNLKGLSIHRSSYGSGSTSPQVEELVQLCDLELFQLQQQPHTLDTEDKELRTLIRSLMGQTNLKALSLMIFYGTLSLGQLVMCDNGDRSELPWPRLRALYLNEIDHFWLERLSEFKDLQILKLRFQPLELTQLNYKHLHEDVSKCSRLTSVDIKVRCKINDAQLLLDIARGCPSLRKLAIRSRYPEEIEDTSEDQFLKIIQSLPRIECLTTSIGVHLSGSRLRDLARYCPRIEILELYCSALSLRYEDLTQLTPFRQLQFMRFDMVKYLIGKNRSGSEERQSLEIAWEKAFPKLREPPSMVLQRPPGQEDKREEDGTRISGKAGNWPGSCINLRRAWLLLTTTVVTIWKLRGFSRNVGTLKKLNHIWQSNLETEILGWPMLPIKAFITPDRYCSSSKVPRSHQLNQ